MDRKPPRTAPALASSSLFRRWLKPQAPHLAVDSSQLDLGYESALPWFSEADTGTSTSQPEAGQAPA
jgi:hypothetical protein